MARKVRTLAELREIGEYVVQAAKNALREGANTVADDAKSRAPVKTGRLRDSIKVTANSKGDRIKISAKAFKESATKKFYYGRKAEAKKSFLYPSLDAHREEIYKNIDDAVHNAIRGE